MAIDILKRETGPLRVAVLSLLILIPLVTTHCASTTRKATMHNEVIVLGGSMLADPDHGHFLHSSQGELAVYATDGVVREIGRGSDLRREHAAARIIDARGGTILPGLTDAHGHLYGLGLALDVVDLAGANSYDEVIARTRARSEHAAANEWILGRGWDQNRWADRQFPTAPALDAAIAGHPVWLKRVDGHAGLANTAALRAAGITAATPDPEGGRIIRDAAGNPTGVFVDGAMSLVEEKIPAPSFALRKKRVLAAAREIARNGLTEMHDAGAEEGTIRAVKELIDEGLFPIRVYMMLTDDAHLIDSYFSSGPLLDYGHRLTVRSIKMYADGALGSRGAALIAPYSDDPGNSGLLLAKPEHLADVATRARAHGFQVNTHAIGDRGVDNVINGYEAAGVTPSERFRIEHYQVVTPADFTRLGRDGIIASMQPTHATSDMPWAERRLGPERIRGAYAWRTVLDTKGRLALGSDFPVESVNPFLGIHAAVTRQDQQGNPPGGWYPEQRLTLLEAIRGFTSDAAFAAFEETSRGTIEPGKLADFTIVEGDLSATPASDLWKARVLYTVVGGEMVYDGVTRK
jgi:predicted amidohydrolase YtcJ